MTSGATIGKDEVRFVSTLKETGRDDELLALLRDVDPTIRSLELLSPGGESAELYVRLGQGTLLLPVVMMGEGFQRCLQLGAAAAVDDWPVLFVDEIEQGIGEPELGIGIPPFRGNTRAADEGIIRAVDQRKRIQQE